MAYELPPHLNESARRETFRGPIEYDEQNVQWSPTPLDPYAVLRRAKDGAYENYVHAAQTSIEDRIEERAEQMGGIPEVFQRQAVKELEAALDVRVDRNNQSFQRLLRSIEGKSLDEEMKSIIEKSRGGSANTAEILRLIKEHPDMISVEFFKRTTPFDVDEFTKAKMMLQAQLRVLREDFKDAEITLDMDSKTVAAEPFVTQHGAIVWKQKVGEARSIDSHIEVIVKHSLLALPSDLNLNKNTMSKLVTSKGQPFSNILPLSLSAYLRTADYKTREGYQSPDDEIRYEVDERVISELGINAMRHYDTLRAIPENMRSSYLAGVKVAEKTPR